MKKILLSLFSIGIVGTAATYATIAYFNSTSQVLGNTISTGTMNSTGIVQDTSCNSAGDSGKFSVSNLSPGESFVRCLWIKNTGTVAGRYKIYASAESGNTALGDQLSIDAVLNPDSGDCSGLTNPFDPDGIIYGTSNLQKSPAWDNVAARGAFANAATTPFKIEGGEPAMPGGYYSLFRITVNLDPDSELQEASFTQDITIYGLQDAGSLSW